ncbi:hypothetical protein GKE82_05710 [Conexibacter sp. W3-3-2]|uniref:universal stress protein n=1 Tax=Conexibacter sp. W3-3-2 TaxID=2675227 RepID=UPI0012B789B1|nr:universal stress protein [Conexibacter sp. W3-3-2]MTD43814.1 hypothetical protein [Conexibacter sp. W3-3-2]
MQELRFKNLLVAVDGSPGSALALAAAVSAAQRDHARLTLLTVVPDVLTETTRWGNAAALPTGDLQGDADRMGRETLQDAGREIPQDLPVTLRVRHGKAAAQIVQEAQETDYDAIVMGARGRSRVGALMGSVSQEVLHHSPTRVFVAHEPAAA